MMENSSEDEVRFIEEENNVNVTQVMITANSNVYIQTKERFRDFKADMNKLFKGPLAKEYKAYLFGSKAVVSAVEANSFGVEVGKKQQRGHVHVVFTIKHHAAKYSVSKLRDRFQKVLNEVDTWSKGWYVYATLLPQSRLNYANKEIRHEENNRTLEEADEVTALELNRLNDPRQLVALDTDEGGTIYKLQALTL
jgi:hypothetical protein